MQLIKDKQNLIQEAYENYQILLKAFILGGVNEHWTISVEEIV
jgi:hypothetical protein